MTKKPITSNTATPAKITALLDQLAEAQKRTELFNARLNTLAETLYQDLVVQTNGQRGIWINSSDAILNNVEKYFRFLSTAGKRTRGDYLSELEDAKRHEATSSQLLTELQALVNDAGLSRDLEITAVRETLARGFRAALKPFADEEEAEQILTESNRFTALQGRIGRWKPGVATSDYNRWTGAARALLSELSTSLNPTQPNAES